MNCGTVWTFVVSVLSPLTFFFANDCICYPPPFLNHLHESMGDARDMLEVVSQAVIVGAEQFGRIDRAYRGGADPPGKITHFTDGFGRLDVGDVHEIPGHVRAVYLHSAGTDDVESRIRHILVDELFTGGNTDLGEFGAESGQFHPGQGTEHRADFNSVDALLSDGGIQVFPADLLVFDQDFPDGFD